MENLASVCLGRCVVCLAPSVGKTRCANLTKGSYLLGFDIEVCEQHLGTGVLYEYLGD